MPARLILNADDFGLTRGINRAIAELHRAGVLTSATLMATGPAFDDAVALARSLPSLGVGCHIVVVDGTPVSAPKDIPTLLGPDRIHFRPSLASFVRDLFLGRIDQEDIAREALAQVQKLQRAGIDVTHVDTHKHTHLFPRVAKPLIDLVNMTSIGAIRFPFEPAFALNLSHPGFTRKLQLSALDRYRPSFSKLMVRTLTPDGTLGIAATGTLNPSILHALLASLPDDGVYELCCHPGYGDSDLQAVNTRLLHSRDVEREALLSEVPKILALPHPPELIHYRNLKQTAIGVP